MPYVTDIRRNQKLKFQKIMDFRKYIWRVSEMGQRVTQSDGDVGFENNGFAYKVLPFWGKNFSMGSTLGIKPSHTHMTP